MIKDYKYAGTFYPENKSELFNLIESFEEKEPKYYTKAVIVPHAGFIYSGKLTARGINHLDKKTKNVFIIAPVHFEKIYGSITCNYSAFNTPLGKLKINDEITRYLIKNFEYPVNNYIFDHEHSIEVILPFIKKRLPEAKIIPILYGCENYKNIVKIIEEFYDNEDTAFVISSDLSHFYPEKEALKIDLYTAKMIEENNIRNFESEQACGAVGICALTEFAKEKNFSLIRAGLYNSSDTTKETSRVVGYGCWFLYEGNKNEYIKKYYSDFIIKTCKNSIISGLQLGQFIPQNYDCVFEQAGASFVTLYKNGKLRGCIGSVSAYQSLIKDLYKNAHGAAFSDPRFPALTLHEFEQIEIEVSILSKPERINFEYESDLLAQLKPFKDGLIIRDGLKKSVFLPEVWEQIPDKALFLKELKIKAGLDENYFSENFEAFRFSTTKIS